MQGRRTGPRVRTWLVYRLAACAVFLACAAAAADDINGGWPVDLGTDCSENTTCGQVHLDHWDRPTCMVRIQARQRKDRRFAETYASSAEYFQQLPDGSLANTTDQMTLTLKGCNEFCGSGTFYWDAIPRLTTWIIPVVLLLSNIELSPIDKHRFMTIIHAVGDPIDSLWSLLHKIYVWRCLHAMGINRCGPRAPNQSWWSYTKTRWAERWRRWRRWWRRSLRHVKHRWQRFAAAAQRWVGMGQPREGNEAAGRGPGATDASKKKKKQDEVDDEEEFNEPHDRARVIATVLAGFEEISGAYITTELQYTMVLDELGGIGPLETQSPGAWHEWRHCARMLADARTNEFLRTLLAIFVYIFGVLAALDDAVGGGNTSKPGGRIGSAVFLMWLVPLALLSNVVGTFTSRRTCLTIMRLFVQRAKAAVRREERLKEDARRNREAGERGRGKQPAAAGGSVPEQEDREASPPVRDSGQSFRLSSPMISVGLSATLGADDEVLPPSTPSPDGSSIRANRSDSDVPPEGGSTRAATPGILLLNPSAKRSAGSSSRPGVGQRASGSGSASGGTRRRSSVTFVSGDEGPHGVELRPKRPKQHQRRRQQSGEDYADVDPVTTGYSAPSSGGWSTGGGSSAGTLPASGSISSMSSRAPLLGPQSPDFRNYRLRRSSNAGPSTAAASPLGAADAGPAADADGDKELLMDFTSWAEYFSALHWLGAVYTYRPWKIGYRSVHGKSHLPYAPNWFLYLLALFPVIVSAAGAFVIMWWAVPVGWSCRHVWVLGLTVAWLLSNTITIWLHNDKIPTDDAENGVGVDFNENWNSGAAPDSAREPLLDPIRDPHSRGPSPSTGAARAAESSRSSVNDQGDGAHASAESRLLRGSDDGDLGTSDNLSPPTDIPQRPPNNPSNQARGSGAAAFEAPAISWRRHPWRSAWRFVLGPGHWSERRRWYTVLAKDAVVGLGGLAVVFLSTSGLFNNCWCWSAYMWHRWIPGDWGREAFVPLNTEDEYAVRADVVYGRVVWLALGLQLVFFFGVVGLWWDGVSVVRWNESRRRREWRHEVVGPDDEGAGGDIEHDDANYLLFWYSKTELDQQRRALRLRRSTFVQQRGQRRGSSVVQPQEEGAAGSRGNRPRSRSFITRNPQMRTQTIQVERGEERES